MAFQDLWQGAKRFFGPDNPFFHGPQEDQPQPPVEEPAPQMEAPQPEPQPQPYQQPAYQQGQPYQQQAYQPPYQQAYQQPQQQAYQQPAPQPQPQNPFQQGYRPPQPQSVNEPYVAPRNRRSQQHQQPVQPQPQPPQMDMNGNVVPFPNAQQPQAAAQQKSPNACVINVRSIADCRNAIGILRSNDCVLAVMDSIADQAEVRRYVDTLNGACFSLGCTMTRLSARVGVYLLAPAGMNVYTDQATTQMNSQSRAPQRPQQPQQAFRPPYQQPAPQQPYAQAPQGYQQPQQMNAPMFSAQSPAQGYSPDMNDAEYNAI